MQTGYRVKFLVTRERKLNLSRGSDSEGGWVEDAAVAAAKETIFSLPYCAQGAQRDDVVLFAPSRNQP